MKTLNIFYNLLRFEDNVDDHELGKIASQEKFEKDDYLCDGQILVLLMIKYMTSIVRLV